jgi:hypothetical protein
MSPQPQSRAVRAGYGLATLMLVLTAVFGAVVVASIVVGVARHGDSLLYGHVLEVPLRLSPDDVAGLPPDVRPHGWPAVDVRVAGPTTEQTVLRSVQDVGPLLLLLAGLWLLRGFLRSVLAGDPFGAANVRRLRGVGFILVLGAPLVELLNHSLRQQLFDNLPPHPSLNLGLPGFAIPGNALVGGLGAFILAEVLAYGLRLREDVEGTV